MPRSARWCTGSEFTSSPWNRIRPDFTGRKPMMLSMVVVLPAPLRPTRHTTSRSRTLSETLCRMCAGPRKVSMSFTSSIDVGPEQVLGHVGVVADRLGRTVGEEPAFVHHDHAVRVLEHHVHVVL